MSSQLQLTRVPAPYNAWHSLTQFQLLTESTASLSNVSGGQWDVWQNDNMFITEIIWMFLAHMWKFQA